MKKLTQRELEVIGLIIEGYTNKEISAHLGISLHTVKSHLESIYPKFNVHNRAQAAVYAVKNSMVEEN